MAAVGLAGSSLVLVQPRIVALADPGDCALASPGASSGDAAAALDADESTAWRSAVHGTSVEPEWIEATLSGSAPVQAVRLTPRTEAGAPTGFPSAFTILGDGTPARSDAGFPQPVAAPVTLLLEEPLHPGSVLRIEASALGAVSGGWGFDLAEVSAVCDSSLAAVRYRGNDATPGRVLIDGVGAGTFDPTKLANMVPDVRQPLIPARPGTYQNIYGANAHRVGDRWRIYFGGWNGVEDPVDEIWLTGTDDWLSFDEHQSVISHGEVKLLNNPTAVRTDSGWYMLVTTNPADPDAALADRLLTSGFLAKGKTGYLTSPDGVAWSPNPFTREHFITMSGYAGYDSSNINASKTVWFEDGTYTMLFSDLSQLSLPPGRIFWATSTDGEHYQYRGVAEGSIGCRIPMDIRRYGSTFALFSNCTGTNVTLNLGSSVSSYEPTRVLYQGTATHERQVVSVGAVDDGNGTFMGIVIGSSFATAELKVAMYGVWLQRFTRLIDGSGGVVGSGTRALGPTTSVLSLSTPAPMVDARLDLADSDRTTALLSTIALTIRPGDRFAVTL